MFPFLPRQLTLIGALTIGIPSFFLALAPNTNVSGPGSCRACCGSRSRRARSRRSRRSSATRSRREEPGVTLAEARTTAMMVLHLDRVAGAVDHRGAAHAGRLALVWSMAGLFVLVLVIPATTRTFFALYPPPLIVWLASFGIAAIVWSFARLFVPPGSGRWVRGAPTAPAESASRLGLDAARSRDGGQIARTPCRSPCRAGRTRDRTGSPSEFAAVVAHHEERVRRAPSCSGKSSRLRCWVRYGSSIGSPST